MFRIICIITLISVSQSVLAMKRASFPLKDELRVPLVALLDEAVSLHQAFYSKKEEQVHLTVSKMVNQIEMLERFPNLLPYHQWSYIYKLLQDLKPQLEVMKIAKVKRKVHMNAVNRTLTYMAHVYGLKKYAVFFCPKDRSVWMQGKDVKKMRPLHLEYQSCGALVGK